MFPKIRKDSEVGEEFSKMADRRSVAASPRSLAMVAMIAKKCFTIGNRHVALMACDYPHGML